MGRSKPKTSVQIGSYRMLDQPMLKAEKEKADKGPYRPKPKFEKKLGPYRPNGDKQRGHEAHWVERSRRMKIS